MSDKSSSHNNGINFFGLLTVAFITLKLLDKIDWSWWWVLAPMWIPIAAVFAFAASVVGWGFFKHWWGAAKRRQQRLDRERRDAVFINRKR